jgi:hypothetical protein
MSLLKQAEGFSKALNAVGPANLLSEVAQRHEA